jgi:glutamate 5-kinase
VAYDAADVARILGKRSSELEAALGYRSVEELIHRDDLVLLAGDDDETRKVAP